MQKIVFEDTTVVKSPYVTIDGVEYSVENGTYQGGTDLNADTFNTMQDNIENAINSIELSGGGDEVGTVKMFSGSTAPQGWLICDGSAISRTEYAELFSAIGTTYGSGDGSTTFNIPNLKGRVAVGLDSNDTDFNAIGKTYGEKINSELNCGSVTWGLTNNLPGYMDRTIVKKTPISQTHGEISAEISNVQPSIVLNYIIKASATTTTQGQIIDSLNGNSTTDAPSVHAVNEKFNTITSYSTTEVVIGTYDNKPLYRKTFKGQYTSSTTRVNVDLISNVSKIIKSYGLFSPNTTTPTQSFGQPMISTTGSIDAYSLIRVAANNTAQACFSTSQSAYDGQTGSYEVTIEYTKTTD